VRRYERRYCVGRRVGFCRLRLIREHRFKAASLALVMQEDNRDHTNLLLARMTLSYLALQILQKTIGEMIERAFTAGILLVARAAVGTNEFHLVLLRIAVQSGPTRAAHANCLYNSALHGCTPLSSTSMEHEMRYLPCAIHFFEVATENNSARLVVLH